MLDEVSEGSGAPSVLLVEDDDDLRTMLATVLAKAGFSVSTACDGRAAMDALEHGAQPDAIVLDLMMPKMDGWQFRVEQKRDPVLSQIPVVVLTALSTPQAAAIDADASLEKPVRIDQLKRTLHDVIGLRQRREAEASAAHADRLASLGTLSAGIAHEIGNPLAAVLANLTLAERAIDAPSFDRAELKQWLGGAREAAEVVRRIVREVGYFSRASELPERQDVVEVLNGALALLGSELKSRATVESDHAATPPVLARRGELLSVFVNLLVNAAHAFEPGTRGVIRTHTRAEPGWAIVEISDTGVGISPHVLAKIFDPFFTTKPAGQGTGLGLSTCQRIVQAAGGRIEVESAPGKGSRFRVLLPAAPPSD